MIMAHWRLTPQQIKELSPEDVEVMEFAYSMYDRKQTESLNDIIGSLTGTSWSVDGVLAEEQENAEEPKFTWKLRPERSRVSIPLSLVIGGNKVMEHVKKAAQAVRSASRRDASILSLPRSELLKNAEVVDLSKASKEDFLKMASSVKI